MTLLAAFETFADLLRVVVIVLLVPAVLLLLRWCWEEWLKAGDEDLDSLERFHRRPRP